MSICKRKLSLVALFLIGSLSLSVAADKKEPKKQRKAEAVKAEAKPAETPKAAPAPAPVAKTPAKNAAALAAAIDRSIDAKLKEEKVAVSFLASDAEFLRRVCLDITGVLPTAERAKSFLDNKDADKRAKLIDELLDNPEYGKRMADLWGDLLLTRNSDNRLVQFDPFVQWLKDNFNSNKPWNQFSRDLLTAEGPQDKNAAVTYFVANQTVDRITDNVTKNLLGVQLQCAQCHNHPFTSWKQTEYWGMAAFFMKVRLENNRNAQLRTGTAPGVNEGPAINRNRRTLPESAKIVPAKFLQGEEPKLPGAEPFRPALADWITADKNAFFAKAMVNRLWSQFFGRGLVNPVDDMHADNHASHPELLDALAQGFRDNGYDIKETIRGLCNSRAYQRSSKPTGGNEDADHALYARASIKVLTAEMLFDSLQQISGPPSREPRPNPMMNRRGGGGPRQQFVNFFRAEEGADPTEYNHGIPQALRMMNSAQFSRTTMLDRLLKQANKPEEVIEQLYLTTLSRRPTSDEMTKMVAHVKQAEARPAYNDILWALMNTSEFVLNH